MPNAWITHVKKTMRTMKSKGTYKKGMGLKQVIKEAKKTWHKVKKGGDLPTDDTIDTTGTTGTTDTTVTSSDTEPVGGRRRRRKHGTKRRKH